MDAGSPRRSESVLLATRGVVASAILALAGCTSLEPAQRQHRATSTAHSVSRPTEQTLFVGTEGLAEYEQPTASSAVVGHLPPRERVIRVRVHGAYAFVTAAGSGVHGWVENGRLLPHVPASSPATPDQPVPPSLVAATPEPAPPASAVADPGPPPAIAVPEPEPVPTRAPAAKGPPAPATPEMFDPF